MILAAVAATVTPLVSASPVPTPSISPEVIIHTVQVTPEWIKQAIDLLSFVVPGIIASFVHSVVKSRSTKLQADTSDWLNSGLLFLYSALITVAVLATEGKLDFSSWDALVGAFALVFTGASGRYALLKLKPTTSTPTQTQF